MATNSEEFYANLHPHFKKAIEFLNLDAWEPKTIKIFNSGGGYKKVNDTLRKRLVEYFKPHNERLYKILGVKYEWDV